MAEENNYLFSFPEIK